MAGNSNINLLRIPLSWSQDQRQASIAKDSRRVNVLDETSDGRRFVIKRSGLTPVVALGAGFGQGLTYFNNVLYAVVDDAFKVAVGAAPLSGASGALWTEEVPTGFVPWAPRGAYASVVLGDAIYVIAGSNATPANIPDVWTSSDGVNWRQCTGAAPFGPRTGCNAVVLNGKIYVAGGVTPGGVYLNDVWSSPDGTVWTQETANAGWTARETFGMVATSNGIFIMGGVDSTITALNDIWFSSDGATWTQLTVTAPWPARSKMGAVAFNNKIYVIAGYDDGTTTALNDVWESDNGIVWTAISGAAFATARFGMSCVVYNNMIWALGGFDTAELSDVVNTPDGFVWTPVTTTPGWAGRYEGAAVVFRTPSAERFASIWMMTGVGVSSPDDIWVATLDTSIATSTPLTPSVAGSSSYQFNSFQTGTVLLIKNESNLWVYAAGAINKVTDIGYPVETVPGLVVLGGFAYVMDPSGLIYNCALDDPTYWPSLNVLGADYEDDAGVALVKYLNYVIAFGSYTTQMFYDAGLPYGSPLAPYLNANITVGCADAATIAYCGPTLAWVAQTRQGNKQAVVMEGFAPRPISNSFIDQFLNNEVQGFTAFSCTMKGQMLYVVTCVSQDISWAYSFTTQQWYEFSLGLPEGETATFSFAGYAYDLIFAQYMLAPFSGDVSRINDEALDDAGTPFPVYLRTVGFDAGNNRRKFWGRLDIIGDENVGTPSISYTDDDYKTYSTARTVDMNTNRPALFRMGSSRRRAWVYEQLDSNMMRLEALEQQYEQGN